LFLGLWLAAQQLAAYLALGATMEGEKMYRRFGSHSLPRCRAYVKNAAPERRSSLPNHGAIMTVSIAEKKRIVSGFLQRCARYAEEKLVQYQQQLPLATGMDVLTVQDKISHWTAYRAFTEYTIEELTTAELDAWFAEESS
jgi:hypothetical protein